ncbi:hypothetical protein ALC53_08714, partial [Atta colombica]
CYVQTPHGAEGVNVIGTELLHRFGRVQGPNRKGTVGKDWLSVMELNPNNREEEKCNRGRAYNKYKERFVQINKRGFNLTVLSK